MNTATVDKPKATRKRTSRKPVAVDRASAYAAAVMDGSIIAGPDVRNAAARHLRDLKDGHLRGLRWEPEAAADAIAFFEEVLCLNGGEYEGLPFLLDHWQAFIVGSLYGWKSWSEKYGELVRRFRVAYVETGKGSGKSPLAAGIGIKGLCADGEQRAEVYAAATKKDQAQVLFRDAVAMWQQSPTLSSVLKPAGTGENVWNLAYLPTGSFFRPISADDGQSGPRPHISLIDEVHEHRTAAVIEMQRAGFKSRKQPLLFMITNSGAGKNTPCGVYHDYARDVASGKSADDSFFSFVCGLDEDDDPFTDERCWPKSNPSLQHRGLPSIDYLREQVREARGMPSKEAVVRRLNFCEWTAAISPWLSAAIWDPCRRNFLPEDLRGRIAYGGLDLSSTTDLTAFILLVKPEREGEPWHILPWCWLPEQDLKQRCDRDRVDYLTWQKQGLLETTPGAAISRSHVAKRVSQICQDYQVQHIAYDRWNINHLRQTCEDNGIQLPTLVEFGQGFKDMAPAINDFETAILNREVVHNGHPILTWCAANAVTDSDPAGNRKLNKAKATGRIDLIVASVMAYGAAAKEAGEEEQGGFVDLNA